MERYAYVKRLTDGKVLDVPLKHLEATLKRGFVLLDESKEVYRDSDTKFKEPPKDECPFCGVISKEIEKHKTSHL